MTERARRFERREVPAALVLTPRDEAVLLACWEHRWLTREQLRRLVPLPGVGRSNERLRKLYDAGYLGRVRAGTVGAGLQPIYTLGEAAADLVAARTGLPERVVRARVREDGVASAVLLPHDLEVNDFRITLCQALADSPGVRVELWHNAAECFDAYTSQHVLRPDGYVRFWHGDILAAFFVEVDRGTTSLARWRTKVTRYVEYRANGAYSRRYHLSRFRVLVTAPSTARLQQLRATTATVNPRGFYFGLLSDVLANADPRRRVWLPAEGDVPRALIDDGRVS